MCGVVSPAYMSGHHVLVHLVPMEIRREYISKRVQDSLDLGLLMVVRHQVDAGNQRQLLCKSCRCP